MSGRGSSAWCSGVLAGALAAVLAACGAAKGRGVADPIELLGRGDWEGARRAVAGRGTDSPEDRAVVAASHLLERRDRQGAAEAVSVLSRGDDVAAAAIELLDLFSTLDLRLEGDGALMEAEVALGAVGLGAMATSRASIAPGGEPGRALALAVLERLSFAIRTANAGPLPEGRLIDSWNGAFALLGGSTGATDDIEAWRLYLAAGWIAVAVAESSPDAELTEVLLSFAIGVVEENQDIAVAARCDLSSPFDRMRTAVARDRALLGRLERAVASAMGCSRGTLAPTASPER